MRRPRLDDQQRRLPVQPGGDDLGNVGTKQVSGRPFASRSGGNRPPGDLRLADALGADESRRCLREWLARVPNPRSRLGRWHPLVFVLVVAVCAFTAAGHDSPEAIAGRAACCSQQPSLLQAVTNALAGSAADFAGTS